MTMKWDLPPHVKHTTVMFWLRLCCFVGLLSAVFPIEASPENTHALSQPVYKTLEVARAHTLNGAYAEAGQLIASLQKDDSLSAYEKAQVWNLAGYVDYLRGFIPRAISAYEVVLQQVDIPESLLISTHRTLAQLWFMEAGYRKALSYAEQIRSADVAADSRHVDSSLQVLMAHCHYQLSDYRRSAALISSVIEQAGQPEESWLQLLRASYQAQNDYEKTARVLETMVELFGKPDYFLALSATYSQLGQQARQISLLESLYEKQQLTSASHLKALGILYVQQGMPAKAAAVLGYGIDSNHLEASAENLRLLAQAWLRARNNDNAIKVLVRASSLHNDKKIDLLLARTFLSMRDWESAATRLQRVLDNQGNKDSEVWLLLGMARFHQGDYASAESAFINARDRGKAWVHNSARQWLSHVQAEQKKSMTATARLAM